MQSTEPSIIWRRLDRPGHEAARLFSSDSRWNLVGTAVFMDHPRPCHLNYQIECDPDWHTRSTKVEGWIGEDVIEIRASLDADGHWYLNGKQSPQVSGCIDIDLNFSPVTNLLPIRRLKLEVGQESLVKAAWLRFPSFELELLEQIYRRVGPTSYRYESAGGKFVADLEVDASGFVVNYPGVWRAEG